MTGPAGELTSLGGGSSALRGYLYRPAGAGPAPAVVWNHGSERDPGRQETLGRFYSDAGYALLALHRRGHGESPGAYELDEIAEQARRDAADPADVHATVVDLVIAHHERRVADTVAAIEWLAAQPAVDAARIAVSGVSFGATQALLAAEASAGAAAYVAFGPSATAWSTAPALRARLLQAVQAASAPTLIVQAANDHDLGPSEVLGAALERRGPPSRALVCPPFGETAAEGHGAFGCEGMAVWGADVLAFLSETIG